MISKEVAKTGISEGGQSIRRNRSTMDATFILEITKKPIDFNRTPLYAPYISFELFIW